MSREPANICTPRNEFFLNRVIPLWNELPQKVREAKSLNCFKAGWVKWNYLKYKCKFTFIYKKTHLL